MKTFPTDNIPFYTRNSSQNKEVLLEIKYIFTTLTKHYLIYLKSLKITDPNVYLRISLR